MLSAPEQAGKSGKNIGRAIFGGMFKFVRKLQLLRTEYQWRAERYRSRKELLRMDDHLLRDIGITRDDAIEEAKRDFWD
ncbi:MAG: DUF1127 domain-containing protein [Salaquimonas sp.]